MEGVAERERRNIERVVAQAWWNEAFNGAGSKLKPLGHYLDQMKPKKPQSSEEMLAVWQEHAARAPGLIKVRHIRPEEVN